MIEKIKTFLRVQEEGIGVFNLFLLGSVIFIAVFSIGQFLNNKVIEIGLRNSLPDYKIINNVFVDQNYSGKKIDGSPSYPFPKITSALELIQEKNTIENIYIKPGKYTETPLEIPENINLIAPWPETYIINEALTEKSLVLNGENAIRGLVVQGGKYAVYAKKDFSNILIENCKIQNADWYGIFNEESFNENSNYQFRIVDSEISNNDKGGLLLEKSSFLIENSLIKENNAGGIKIKPETALMIMETEIFGNAQGSGLEAELENSNLSIKDSLIENNNFSGLELKADSENFTFEIENTKIINNGDFGINCSTNSEKLYPKFLKAMGEEIFSNNQFLKQKKAINTNCWK
jgi:hypothetical protein